MSCRITTRSTRVRALDATCDRCVLRTHLSCRITKEDSVRRVASMSHRCRMSHRLFRGQIWERYTQHLCSRFERIEASR